MYQQQPSIKSIKRLLNDVFEEVSEVSIDYVKMWEYIYWACSIRSDDYLDTIDLVRQCDKEHDIFHHAVMCNPEVFISGITTPRFSSVLQSIKDNHEDCETIELCLLNGYALSVIVADPLFEEFRLKITSIRIGGINLCQDIYNEVKEKNSSRGVDKCSEEDVDFLVRGVMYESHIKKYLHLFPNLIYLDCVVAEQKCCEVLFKTLQHYTPELYYLSLKCANVVPAVEWEISKEVNNIQLKVVELLLVNCSMDLLMYFSEIESLFIIAPQNLPEDRKILLHDYYYNPDSVVQLLVSTNSYMVDSDGKISCVPVDYDIMSFQKLEVLAINPCQDMSSILYIDGLWDTEAGLNFVDQLITSRKYNLLSGLVDSHPSLLNRLFFVTSPIHKIDLLEDNEELFPKLMTCHFKNGASLIKSLGVGYLIPHFSYSKFGASKRDLKLIQLRVKIAKVLKDFESELFDNETIYGDIIKYITRLACDANEVGRDQSASDKFLKNVLSEAHFYDPVSLRYLVKIVSVNFPVMFCGEFFGSLLDYEESLHIYLVRGIGAFIRRKFIEGSIKTLADLKDALLVFQKSNHGKVHVAGANETVSRMQDAILFSFIQQSPQNSHGSAKAWCLSKLDLYAKEILNDVIGVANVLQIKDRKITSFVESTLCKTIPCIMNNITSTIGNTYANLIDDFWEDIFASYDDKFINMLPNNYQFCTALVACSAIVKSIEGASPYVRAFLLLDKVGIKLTELKYSYMRLWTLKLSQYSDKMFSSLSILTFLRQVLNFSGMSDGKIRDYLSFCGVKDFASMIVVISNLAFNKLRNFREQWLIADHRDLGFYENLNQAFIQHKMSHEFMLKILSDVLANTTIEIIRLYELHLVPLLKKNVQSLIFAISSAQDMLQTKSVISAYMVSIRDVFIVKNDLYHFVDDEIVDSDVEMFNRIQSFPPVSRKGLLDILNIMFCAENVDLLIAQQSSCVLMYLQPMMQGISFSFKNLNRHRFLYRAINTMYIPYENKYEDSFTKLQGISNVPVVLVSLLFQKIFYSYAKGTIDKQLLFKILYKFQQYFDFQFIQYCFILPQVLGNDANVFIYVKQSQNLVQVLRRVEPEVIINTIDNVVRSEVDITELYNTVLSSLILLDKNAVPELNSEEKDYFSKMVDLFQTNFETHGILDGDVMRIISVKLTFEDWVALNSKCISNCIFASLSNIKTLKDAQEYRDLWVVDIRNQILECKGFPNLNVLDITNDLVNKCKNVDGINYLTYQLILNKLKPSICPVQYLDEIACCIVLDLVQHIVDNEHMNVFCERLVDALVSRKKLSTMQNICETVLQTLKDFLLSKDEFLISVSSHRQTSLEKEEQTSADSLLSKCFAEWCYVILENLFKGKNLANSVKSYSIAQFVSDNGLPESALLDLEKRMKRVQRFDKYLRLVDRFKSICMRNDNGGIQDRIDTRSRQIFNIENSQIIPLMQKRLSMNKDNIDGNISRLLNDDQYDFAPSREKSKQILKIVAMMFYSLKPYNKQLISVNQYVCDNVYISLMKVFLMSAFFDKGMMSDFEIILVVRVLLNMFCTNPYFIDMKYLDFSENILNYVTQIQYGDFEDKTPRKICNLGFHLVWEMLGVLLQDLLLNCLSDVDSSLCYAEDYFKRLNSIDDYTMLLIKFYHRNVLLQYSRQSSVNKTLAFHPVVFLCKFLKVFDYDLLKYYCPEVVITLADDISEDQVPGMVATHSLRSGTELSELNGNSVSKKQRNRKKSRKKEEQVYRVIAGNTELMHCDETVKEFLIGRCVNDLSEAVTYIPEVKDSNHLVVKEENFAGVTDALSKSRGLSDQVENEKVRQDKGSKAQKNSKKGGKKAKKGAESKDKIESSVPEQVDILSVDESVSNRDDLEEKTASDIKVENTLPKQEKESSIIVAEILANKAQESSVEFTSEQVLKKTENKAQKNSKKGDKKAKKGTESKKNELVELVSIVEESIDESLNHEDNLECGVIDDGCVTGFKSSEILLIQNESSDGQELLTRSLSGKASKKARKQALKMQEDCQKSKKKAQKNTKHNNARKIVRAETESTSILEDRYSSVSTISKRPISDVVEKAVLQSSYIGQGCRQLQVNYIEICDEILHTHRSDLEKLFGSYDEQRLRVIIESIGVKNLVSQKIINLEMKRMKRIATSNTSLNVVMPSLGYASSLYHISSESMCGLRFSHFLYSVQLIDSLFEVVTSNSGLRKVVVKGTAHRVLKNVFGYRKDYNFFVILMKVFVLLNLSTIAISHSDVNLKRINVYFKHSCNVFGMNLNPILLEVIQVLESIKGKEIDLYQLQSCMSGIFCKFFKESMPNDNYSLRFLKSLLSILSIITVDTALANDNDLRIVRDAAMFGCIIYIGSMSQQYTVQYFKLEQDNHPFKKLTCQNRSFWFMQEDYKKVVNLIKLFNTFRNRLVHCYDSENKRFAERFKALSSQGRCFNSKYDIADVLPAETKHKCYHAWHDTSDFFAALSITVLQTELLLINDSDCDSLGYSFLNRMYAFFQRCNMDIYPYALSERVNVDTDKMLALMRLRTALSTFCSNSASGFETRRHYILSLNQTLENMQYYCDNRLFSTCIKKYTVISELLEQGRAISFDADSMTDTPPIHDSENNFQYDGNSNVFKKQDVRSDDVHEQDTIVDVKLGMSTDTDLVESMQCDDSLSVSVGCDTSFIDSTFEQRNYTPAVDLKVPSCSRSFDIEDNSNSRLTNVTKQGSSSTSLEAPSYSGLLDVESMNSSINRNYTSNARLEEVHSYSMQNAQCANNLPRSVVNNREVTDLPVQESLPFSSNLVGDVQYADNLTVSCCSDTDLVDLSKRVRRFSARSRIRRYKRQISNIQNTYNPLVCANDSDFMGSAYTHQKNRTTYNARLSMRDYNGSAKIMQPSRNLPSNQLNRNPQVQNYSALGARPKTHYGSQQKKDVQHTTNLPNIGNNSSSIINDCFTQRYSTFSDISESNVRYVDNPLVSEKLAVSLDGQRYLTRNTRLGVPNYDISKVQPSHNLQSSQLNKNPQVQNYSALGARPKTHYGSQQKKDVQHTTNLPNIGNNSSSIINDCFTQRYSTFSNISESDVWYVDNPLVSEKLAVSLDGQRYLARNTRLSMPTYDDSVGMMQCSGSLPRCQVGNYPTVITNPNVQQHATSLNTRLSLYVDDCSVESVPHDDLQVDDFMNSIANLCVQECCYPAGYKYIRN